VEQADADGLDLSLAEQVGLVTSMSVQDMAAVSAFAASTPPPASPTTSTAAR
jgi:hypothetical protein